MNQIDPLKIWNSPEVKELLKDFFLANFTAVGLDSKIPEEIIELAWKARTSQNREVERKQIHELFELAKSQSRGSLAEVNPINLFDFTKIKTFLDIGANRLDMLNYLAHTQPSIEKLYAVDVVPQNANFRYPDKSVYYQIKEDATELPIEENSIDLINIQFVLHHFPDQESIERMIKNCARVLKPGGRIILWEESFVENINVKNLVKINSKLNILTDENFTNRFYSLDEEKRWEFIIANDWIINVKNEHMQWTGMYKTWLEWVGLFENNGFKLQNSFNLGLRINGKLKQGVHCLGIFQKG